MELHEAVTKGMFIVKECARVQRRHKQPNENNTVHFADGSPHWPLETSGLAD